MRTTNDQSNHPEPERIPVLLTKVEAEFINLVIGQGFFSVAYSLKLIHDLILYHSDVPIDSEEKGALFDMMIMFEKLKESE